MKLRVIWPSAIRSMTERRRKGLCGARWQVDGRSCELLSPPSSHKTHEAEISDQPFEVCTPPFLRVGQMDCEIHVERAQQVTDPV